MTQTESCGCGGGATRLVFACSGSSNVGQLANEVGLRLAEQRLAKMSCVAAIGAHLDGFVVSARDCDQLVVVDGCERTCALLTFRQAGVEPQVHLTLTDQGFEKKHDARPGEAEVARALNLIKDRMQV